MVPSLAVLLLALAPALPAAPSTSPPPLQAPEQRRESLEAYLDRARARRSELMARLGPQVDAVMQRAERTDNAARRDGREAQVSELAALGIEVTPLVVAYLEPKPESAAGKRECAQVAASVLARTGVGPVVDDLLVLLSKGSETGRGHAARALALAGDDERVRPALRSAFDATAAALPRQAILKALIELGGPENDALLRGVLASTDSQLVSLALNALKETRSAAAAEAVRELLADSPRAARHIPELIAYYRAVPAAFGSVELRAAVAISLGPAAVDLRVLLLESIAHLWSSADAELSRALAPAVAAADARVREAALVTLARLGDRGARKDVLKTYDDNIERNKGYAEAHARRAQLYARLGDDDAAIKDYLKALQLGRNDGPVQPDIHVGLARSYARRGKLREAADVLSKGPISIAQLRVLESDPDFKELASSRYGKDLFGR